MTTTNALPFDPADLLSMDADGSPEYLRGAADSAEDIAVMLLVRSMVSAMIDPAELAQVLMEDVEALRLDADHAEALERNAALDAEETELARGRDFEVGDVVRIAAPEERYDGRIGVVAEWDGGDFEYRVRLSGDEAGDTTGFSGDELTLVARPVKGSIRAGARVVTLSDAGDPGNAKVGELGLVMAVEAAGDQALALLHVRQDNGVRVQQFADRYARVEAAA